MTLAVCAFGLAWENWRMLSRLLNPIILQLPYFAWLPRLPASALPVFIGTWAIASAAFLLGWKTRVAGAIITGLCGYTLLLDQQLYSNHLYLFFLIVLLLSVLAVSAIVLELFIAFGLWNKRLRWFAVIGGIALHAFILTTLDSSRLS